MELSPAMQARLREAAEAVPAAQAHRDQVIGEAWKAGASIRHIAEVCGMTHQGVSKILERTGVRQPWGYADEARARREMRGER